MRGEERGGGMLTATIDGRQIEAASGSTVIQAAEHAGIYIPRYCYHPGLTIAGNCRICLVEIENNPKLQIACNTLVTDGMVVHTHSPTAEDGRRAVLEFLLANHPLDCPVCDQSGECDLQNFYMSFGLYDPRFREQKVKKKKAVAVGPHVMLDQERCILCSRCVRFTDEISKSGELGIFGRGDRAEVNVYPGQQLDNKYSANVVDICPVGALTEREFRFKARVWYLSSAPAVCNGCSQGCNIELHYALGRPHLNDGARVLRIKPRYNADVNQWWICDAGRYGFGWVDRDRLTGVRHRGAAATWEQAMSAILPALAGVRDNGARLGVIASTQLTTEELYLVREVFGTGLGARVTASVPSAPGDSDDFLIKADKTPNARGAALLRLSGNGTDAAAALVEDAIQGRLDALWVFGQDLTAVAGEAALQTLVGSLELFVFAGTNANPTASAAHWVLPTAAYVEKDGTFVNCLGRIQRVGRAFKPLPDAREDWRLLLDVAHGLGQPLPCRTPQEVFALLAATEPPFAGMTYDTIGWEGAALRSAARDIVPGMP
jgi:NADH-quinone oxidoreductase subunit G